VPGVPAGYAKKLKPKCVMATELSAPAMATIDAYLTMATVRPTVPAMEKTGTQLRAESITRGNIASLQARLDAETNEGKRGWLKSLLAEQRALIIPD
jgi:hypothetical protein